MIWVAAEVDQAALTLQGQGQLVAESESTQAVPAM